MADEVRRCFANDFPPIASVVVGLGYTGVKLVGGAMGVAYTVTSQQNWHSCTFFREGGALEDQTVGQVLQTALARDARPKDRSLGAATLSALTTSLVILNQINHNQRDTLDYLDLQSQDHVAIGGGIGSIIPQITRSGCVLTVIDNNPLLSKSSDYEVRRDPDAISEANKIILTGSALVYNTLDELPKWGAHAEKIILLGPFASLPPNPLKAYGVVALGAIIIDDTEYALKAISQGAGTPALMKGSRKITILPS